MVESENAPAPSAMAERSTVIHRPHGTRLERIVTSRPTHSTAAADTSPTNSITPRNISQVAKTGYALTWRRSVAIAVVIASFLPEARSRHSARCPDLHAGG